MESVCLRHPECFQVIISVSHSGFGIIDDIASHLHPFLRKLHHVLLNSFGFISLGF